MTAKGKFPLVGFVSDVRNPDTRDLLRHLVEAGEGLSLAELAAAMNRPRDEVRDQARGLEKRGALKITKRKRLWRRSGPHYEVAAIVLNTHWVLVGLGLVPGRRLPTEAELAEVKAHIAKRREDPEFMERLNRIYEKELPWERRGGSSA